MLGTEADEVLTERVKMLRNNAGPDDDAAAVKFNDMMAGHYEQ